MGDAADPFFSLLHKEENGTMLTVLTVHPSPLQITTHLYGTHSTNWAKVGKRIQLN